MPKLLSSAQIVTVLMEHGFAFVSQRGSHIKYRHPNGRSAIVPAGRSAIPRGTCGSIIRQSGLARELFD